MAINPNALPPGLAGASITSDHSGDANDDLRTAVMAIQKWLESNQDDQDAHAVMKCLVALQGVLAGHAKNHDAAIGITPTLKHVRRVTRGSGY